MCTVYSGRVPSRVLYTCNGVKQGGVISPILLAIYYDQLMSILTSPCGCRLAKHCVGALPYADALKIY